MRRKLAQRIGLGRAVVGATAVLATALTMALTMAVAPVAGAAVTAATPWNAMSVVSPLTSTYHTFNGVSCPGNSGKFCAAVGYDTKGPLAEVWRGGAWKLTSVPNPQGDDWLSSVSCTSPSFCMAMGYTGAGSYAVVWNGLSWSVSTTAFGIFAGARVSCVATDCLAVSDNRNAPGPARAFFFDGQSWTEVSPNVNDLFDVSCIAPTHCLVVGETTPGQPALFDYSDGTWTVEPSTPQNVEPNFISCATASTPVTCMTLGDGGWDNGVRGALLWNVSTLSWTTVESPPATSSFGGVAPLSCPSATECVAVGTQDVPPTDNVSPLAEIWNGSAWSVMNTKALDFGTVVGGSHYFPWHDVSCATTTFCVAVGEKGTSNPAVPAADSWGTAP